MAQTTQTLYSPSMKPLEYLTGLEWDGTPRIDGWLSRYMGATADGSAPGYLTAVGSKWLIAAVARIFLPGCRADSILILEGEPGSGRSSALRILGGEWFTDELHVSGSKDSAMQLEGYWIVEIPEMGSMLKAEVQTVKTFAARLVDRYRPSFSSNVIEVPRACVFAGQVNPGEYLREDAGSRRFWPIGCGRIDLDGLQQDRDQLWAEAASRFQGWDIWWLESTEILLRAARQEAI
jgi:predicted P-loop ATPase